MKTLPLLLTTGALALFAAGCGGDDESSSDTGSGSNARGYAETGQAVSDICKRARAENETLGAGLNGQAANDAPLIGKVVDANDRYVEELKAIEPDPKLQEAFDKYVAAVEDTQARAREAQKIAESGDDEAYRNAIEAVDNDRVTKPLARALGASECAKDD